jgi:hypothetical protein
MSRNKEASQARDRARQAAAQLKPAAARVKPYPLGHMGSQGGPGPFRGRSRGTEWLRPFACCRALA